MQDSQNYEYHRYQPIEPRTPKKKKRTRLWLAVIGVILAAVIVLIAVDTYNMKYVYPGFRRPAGSYEALTKGLKNLDVIYPESSAYENANDVKYFFRTRTPRRNTKNNGYIIEWSETVDGDEYRHEVECSINRTENDRVYGTESYKGVVIRLSKSQARPDNDGYMGVEFLIGDGHIYIQTHYTLADTSEAHAAEAEAKLREKLLAIAYGMIDESENIEG